MALTYYWEDTTETYNKMLAGLGYTRQYQQLYNNKKNHNQNTSAIGYAYYVIIMKLNGNGRVRYKLGRPLQSQPN